MATFYAVRDNGYGTLFFTGQDKMFNSQAQKFYRPESQRVRQKEREREVLQSLLN